MTGQAVGHFTFDPTTEVWSWSETMFRLFGLQPGEVVPTTRIFEAHLLTADRNRLVPLLKPRNWPSEEPVGCFHRLLTMDGQQRDVLTVMHLEGATGEELIRGYVVDASAEVERASADKAQTDIRAAVESHEVIDQAKGALMLVYGLGDDRAFQMLRWLSQQTNTKLRVLSERIVKAVRSDVDLSEDAWNQLDALISDNVLTPDPEPSDGPGEVCPEVPGRQLFAIDVSTGEEEAVLRARGSLDLATVPALAESLGNMAAQAPGDVTLVVDLSGITHLGSAGMGELEKFQRRCAAKNLQLRIVPPAEAAAVGWSALWPSSTGLRLSR